MGFLWFLVLNESKDLFTINEVLALVDDGIANFSNEYNKSGWGVVVG